MKKENKLKKKINELKKTNQGKAILKLIRWSIFFAILFIVLIISSFIKPPINNNSNNDNLENTSPDNTNDEKIEEHLSSLTLNNIKNTLLNGSYTYNYDITLNNNKYIFNGTKNKDYESGYKETSAGVIKYFIDSTGIYEEKLNTKIPLDNLYEDLDQNYLNLENLLNTISGLDMTLKDSSSDLIYENNSDNIIYNIVINKDKIIKSINISKTNDELLNYQYFLVFTNIEV